MLNLNSIFINSCTVGTPNKAKMGKHKIIPYCEPQVFAQGKSVSTEKCTIANFYTIVESLRASN